MSGNQDEHLLTEFFDRSIASSDDDEYSICMLCTIIKNNPNLIGQATNLIANKIKSDNPIHSLRSIQILEECMAKCGQEFQTEVSKYRFLNKLIELVSPNHSADKTPKEVRNKIMDCLLLWTIQYPDKDKIRLAYDMLIKQGAQSSTTCNNLQNYNTQNRRPQSFMNEENELKLKQLIQSSKKDDLKRANLLIQFFVNQDAKKFERKIQQKAELTKIENTAKLLIEVLNSFNSANETTKDNSRILVLELYESCERYKSCLIKMPDIMEDSEEDLISEIFRINSILLNAIQKYEDIFEAEMSACGLDCENDFNATCLECELSPAHEKISNMRVDELLSTSFHEQNFMENDNILEEKNASNKSDDGLAELNDIFKNLSTFKSEDEISIGDNLGSINFSEPILPLRIDQKEEILTPNEQIQSLKSNENNKNNLLSTIDKISDELFQKNLKSTERTKTFQKESDKKTLNDLVATNKPKSSSNLGDDFLLDTQFKTNSNSLDDIKKLIISETKSLTNIKIISPEKINSNKSLNFTEKPVKHLSEINVDINDVTPSLNKKPEILLNEPKGLNVTLNFTENKPDKDIITIVISTINQNSHNIKDFHIDASVSKPCKIRLLTPTGTSLKGLKPFRPPSDLQQILLVYNPTKNPVNITCILSYILGDDPDPIKESIIAKNIL